MKTDDEASYYPNDLIKKIQKEKIQNLKRIVIKIKKEKKILNNGKRIRR